MTGRWRIRAAVLTMFISVSVFVVYYIASIPIEDTGLALDWYLLHGAMEGGWLHYGDSVLDYPPWPMLPMLPFGLIPFKLSWAIYLYLVVLVPTLAVLRRKRFVVTILLACLAYPTLRTAADGNFEPLVMMGMLLIVWSYPRQRVLPMAAGVLLVTIKPQSALFVVLFLLPLYMFKTWNYRYWLASAGVVVGVVGITLLIWGQDWIQGILTTPDVGSIMDSSLLASLTRIGVFHPNLIMSIRVGLFLVILVFIWRTRYHLSREKVGALIAAGLLVAPYAAGNSAMSIYTVGVIPAFQRRPWATLPLIVLTNLPYLVVGNYELRLYWEPYYWMLYFFVTMIWLMVVAIYVENREATPEPTQSPQIL